MNLVFRYIKWHENDMKYFHVLMKCNEKLLKRLRVSNPGYTCVKHELPLKKENFKELDLPPCNDPYRANRYNSSTWHVCTRCWIRILENTDKYLDIEPDMPKFLKDTKKESKTRWW